MRGVPRPLGWGRLLHHNTMQGGVELDVGRSESVAKEGDSVMHNVESGVDISRHVDQCDWHGVCNGFQDTGASTIVVLARDLIAII